MHGLAFVWRMANDGWRVDVRYNSYSCWCTIAVGISRSHHISRQTSCQYCYCIIICGQIECLRYVTVRLHVQCVLWHVLILFVWPCAWPSFPVTTVYRRTARIVSKEADNWATELSNVQYTYRPMTKLIFYSPINLVMIGCSALINNNVW